MDAREAPADTVVSVMDAYLRRIGARRPERADPAALRSLMLCHVRTVPFENLSIHLHEDIVLEEDALLAKIVDRGRGGFCYELNGAFAALLRHLGFTVALLQARAYGGDGRPGIPYDHLALRVETEDGRPWLVDVGFGDNSHQPLAWDERGDQRDPAGVFRVEAAGGGVLEVSRDGRRQYRLEPGARELADFRVGAWWHRTSPGSPFTRSLVCSLVTTGGRVTLSGRKLVVTADGERHEELLADGAAVLAAYRDHFGLRLDRLPRDPRGGRG
ncbi:arylamine N-acetyltransferase family protein [Streptomyces clavuligerus]|nr:arylamine N-acetyltransferase [Streptomyces clavuligerus]ANW20256.1 acetyltransferase [Streptomyces clavuligerus]WDN51855.1 arylamine N-acetyltransferase [Streptomyces clavuligerus]